MDRDVQNPPASQPQFNARKDIDCDEIRRLVQCKAQRLVARAELPRTDQEDVEQTLYESLLKAWPSYNPNQGRWIPFAERALQNACKVLQRDRFAPKRDCRRNVSLSVTVHLGEETGSTELAQLIEQRDAGNHLGIVHREETETLELREDIATLIANLPYELRELARALKHDESILEVSRRTRVPRSTLYYRLSRVRKAAENAGLAEYL
jgi:RNA polymerase sigma factor (sigma-70 family)